MPFPGKHQLEEVARGRTSSRGKGGPQQYIIRQGSISKFHNPDLLIRLIGEPNETYAQIEGIKTKVLLDSGAQLSSITRTRVNELGLKIQHLQTLLDLEGMGDWRSPMRAMWN